RSLHAHVDVNGARGRVLIADDDGLVLRIGAGQEVFPGGAADAGELVGGAVIAARDDMRQRAAARGFFAVQVEAILGAQARLRIVIGAGLRQVGRAEAGEVHAGGIVIAGGGRVPQPDVLH